MIGHELGIVIARSNPSFLKRQKEQKRKEKAEEKRVARQTKGVPPTPEEQALLDAEADHADPLGGVAEPVAD